MKNIFKYLNNERGDADFMFDAPVFREKSRLSKLYHRIPWKLLFKVLGVLIWFTIPIVCGPLFVFDYPEPWRTISACLFGTEMAISFCIIGIYLSIGFSI